MIINYIITITNKKTKWKVSLNSDKYLYFAFEIHKLQITSRNPPIDGRVALIQLKWPRFFDFLDGSSPV